MVGHGADTKHVHRQPLRVPFHNLRVVSVCIMFAGKYSEGMSLVLNEINKNNSHFDFCEETDIVRVSRCFTVCAVHFFTM